MKTLIINYNRLTLPSKMADWLFPRGCTPIFIDNNSNYPPLLKYYSTCPYRVVRMKENFGHKVVWTQNLLETLNIKDDYIVTDPDLDLSGVPNDFLQVLSEGLKKYVNFAKCGFSLEINDITVLGTYNGGKTIKQWEGVFWEKPLDSMFFDAPIDTTFALYRKGVKEHTTSGIRTNRPYTARHVPWYYNDMNKLPDDEKYYFKTATGSSSFKRNHEKYS